MIAVNTRSFESMGVEVVVGGASPDELDAIRRLFYERDARFSRFRPDSELSRVNASPATKLVVSPLLAETLRTAVAASAATDGLVDPRLGAALEAAGYDRDFALIGDDDGRPIGTADDEPGRTIRLDGRLLTRAPGLCLDLNGVVKSLAVDEAVRLLGVRGFVAAGGDIATSGRFDVELPGGTSILLEGGLATSGTTRRRWLRGGELQHHLIDPRTGRPSTSRWDFVTVAARTCLQADVAAKAAFLLGDDGLSWLDERGLAGRFVDGPVVVENTIWRCALGAAAEPDGAAA